jgi:hypothetical protein
MSLVRICSTAGDVHGWRGDAVCGADLPGAGRCLLAEHWVLRIALNQSFIFYFYLQMHAVHIVKEELELTCTAQ